MTCLFIPPYLLRQLARSDDSSIDRSLIESTLQHDAEVREQRLVARPQPRLLAEPPRDPWVVCDAQHGSVLPGTRRRGPGDTSTRDVAVDEAADSIEAMLTLLRERFGRDSYDDAGATAVVSVHYQRDYDNAFWNGSQLVFGDGDGTIFERFTKPVDVLGHEFGHAIIERTAGLIYRHQPGALNESLADVFGTCLLQELAGHTAEQASWLIGEGIFRPGVAARALRDLANPGTAYDDPRLGKDPQVDHLDRYLETQDDNGGVHLNSGIPNKAFYLAATAIGGRVALGAAQIWYAALCSPEVGPETDFAGFAAATVAAAGDHAEAVRAAWDAVGVTEQSATGRTPTPAGRPDQRVAVRRTGGFAGRTHEGEVDLSSTDPRVPQCRALLQDLQLPTGKSENPWPDMYSYTFDVCGAAPVTVPEHQLSEPLRELARVVLSVES